MPKNLEITEPFLIIVEGLSDQAFFNALLQKHSVREFNVLTPRDIHDLAGGRSDFTRLLNALTTLDEFSQVEGLLIVSDCDEDPERSFAEVTQAIQNTEAFTLDDMTLRFPVPPAPKAKAPGKPSVIVYMVPDANSIGGLENLYIEAAKINYQEKVACVDSLTECASIQSWSIMKKAKAKVRSLIAVACEVKPDASLHKILDLDPRLFPLEADVFRDVLSFVRDFPHLIRE